ncbi:hypothetical protein MRX96_025476 [Rhipicephalus microplus]
MTRGAKEDSRFLTGEAGSSKQWREHGHDSVDTAADAISLYAPGTSSPDQDRAAATTTEVSASAKLQLLVSSATVTGATFLAVTAISVARANSAKSMCFIFIPRLLTSTIQHFGLVR